MQRTLSSHWSRRAISTSLLPLELDFELFDKVDLDESKATVGLRIIWYLITKTEKKWWSPLLKQQGKPPVYFKVDWDKWIDEDDEVGDMKLDDMDFSKSNMGSADDELDGHEDNELTDTVDKDEVQVLI
ncbi:co-chaperone protein p23-1-like [Zingiber officinale]|uniref:co-chaperone protein p23-1-like n=1 Tax=Zingiber officinale TaxID=94328 RepID=UPI001C4DD04F|nr:co-chaperone protein p23-1-like [Zingiber officinale]